MPRDPQARPFRAEKLTKDEVQTGQVLMASLEKAAARAAEAGYE
jgi:hypothetical protein